MPETQFNAWCELKSYLINLYENMSAYEHREKGSSECPGKYLPLDNIKNSNYDSAYKSGWNKNIKSWCIVQI